MKNAQTMESPYERVPAWIFGSAEEGARAVAGEVAALIRVRAEEGRPAVLGLATGATPVPVYRELVRLHRDEGLSFAGVVTFNLDEYYPIQRSHPESYWRFMHDQLFDHVDIQPGNIHLPDGEVDRRDALAACLRYEEAIAAAGGIDLQLLGIGRTGHIGFNEPGSGPDSRTRLVTLDALTRRDAARDFLGEANVPRYAITMGVGTILRARRILLMAWGRNKAEVVAKAMEERPGERLPASHLQLHGSTTFVLDTGSASCLTRNTEPWRVGPVDWDPQLVRRAVIGLSRKVGKPVLKLVDKDYNEEGLADLLTSEGSSYQLNLRIFNVLQHTITGWPGGKPGADDSHRPERAEPARKRVLILTAEPQEDILGMGGTIHRLRQQGHELTIAHATSGDLAVPDRDALAALDLSEEIAATAGAGGLAACRELAGALRAKAAFAEDSEAIRTVKGAIREAEARQSSELLGVDPAALVFLRLPFYRKGRYRQFMAGEEDIAAVRALLERVRPHQVFLSGDQANPVTVPGLTFRVFAEAFGHCVAQSEWPRDTFVWLYRGSGEEWAVDQIDMAVPLSPDELQRKLEAAYQHRSQHSHTPFTLAEERESWQRAEHMNRDTAHAYNRLGMAEYEAIECFARWNPSA